MIRIRPYISSDAECVAGWINDPRTFYKWSAGRFGDYPLTAESMNSYYEANRNSQFAMTATDKTDIVGHFSIRFLDQAKRDVRLGFIIVDGSKRGKGYGKAMVELAIRYAFEIIGAQRVSLAVFDNNESAHSCYKAAGLKDNGVFRMDTMLGEEWKCCEMELRAEEYYAKR